jgi:hypothetical protein
VCSSLLPGKGKVPSMPLTLRVRGEGAYTTYLLFLTYISIPFHDFCYDLNGLSQTQVEKKNLEVLLRGGTRGRSLGLALARQLHLSYALTPSHFSSFGDEI